MSVIGGISLVAGPLERGSTVLFDGMAIIKCVLALLYEVMSVGRSVGWLVGWSVGHANV